MCWSRLSKVAVNVEEIPPTERAHILYNHLYFTPLRALAASAPDGPRRYTGLTRHPNYNPRLIEAALSAAARDLGTHHSIGRSARSSPDRGTSAETEVEGASSSREKGPAQLDIPDVLRRGLENPEELWDHVLRHQLTQLQRNLLITRISLGPLPVYLTGIIRAGSALTETMDTKPMQVDLDAALRF